MFQWNLSTITFGFKIGVLDSRSAAASGAKEQPGSTIKTRPCPNSLIIFAQSTDRQIPELVLSRAMAVRLPIKSAARHGSLYFSQI